MLRLGSNGEQQLTQIHLKRAVKTVCASVHARKVQMTDVVHAVWMFFCSYHWICLVADWTFSVMRMKHWRLHCRALWRLKRTISRCTWTWLKKQRKFLFKEYNKWERTIPAPNSCPIPSYFWQSFLVQWNSSIVHVLLGCHQCVLFYYLHSCLVYVDVLSQYSLIFLLCGNRFFVNRKAIFCSDVLK